MGPSVKWADDKFADVVSTANFFAAMALMWAMAQLVRSWARLRIVAAVAYGLLLVFLVRGFYYKFVDMPTMLEQQAQLLKQGGLRSAELQRNSVRQENQRIDGIQFIGEFVRGACGAAFDDRAGRGDPANKGP